jgi:hypothetical protein
MKKTPPPIQQKSSSINEYINYYMILILWHITQSKQIEKIVLDYTLHNAVCTKLAYPNTPSVREPGTNIGALHFDSQGLQEQKSSELKLRI